MSHVSSSTIKAKIISPNLLLVLSASPPALECGVLRKHCFATNKNRALKPALALWIGCQTLPKILGWLVVAKQSALWEGGSLSALRPTGPAPSDSCCECWSEDGVTESIEFNFRDEEGPNERQKNFIMGDQRLLRTLCTPDKGWVGGRGGT